MNSLEHRRKVSTLCLFYEIYHREDNSFYEYLNHFVATLNVRVSPALGEWLGDPALQN